MKVINAMDAVGGIDREWNTIQTEVTNNACEALRMIRFSCGTQNAVEDRL